MSYVGKWKFHSIGIVTENDEMVYMGTQEYLDSPMCYIDETDEEAVADEMKERKQLVGGQLAICEDGKLYMLMPLPEGVSQEEVDAAVTAGHIKLYDGMMTQEPFEWEDRNGELWVKMEMGEDGFVRLDDENGFISIMTTRYIKAD